MALILLTLVLGIVPATSLVFFAVVALAASAWSIPHGAFSPYWLVTAIMSGAGIVAYIALWLSLGSRVDGKTVTGLLIGIPASLYGYAVLIKANPAVLEHWFYLVGLLLVVAVHVVRYFATKSVEE